MAVHPARAAEDARPQDRRARRLPVHASRETPGQDLHQHRGHPLALPQGRSPGHRRPREHHQPPGPLHDRLPALQLQGTDDAVRAASLSRPSRHRLNPALCKITPNTLAKAYSDAGYFERNVRTIEVLVDREAVENGAAAAGEPWQYYDLGHGFCSYTFFEQCPHLMACAKCDFYTPKTPPGRCSWRPRTTCSACSPPSPSPTTGGLRSTTAKRPWTSCFANSPTSLPRLAPPLARSPSQQPRRSCPSSTSGKARPDQTTIYDSARNLRGCVGRAEPRQTPLVTRLLLDLEDAEGVRSWVDDPGGPGEADVGDAVLGL